MSSLIFDRTRWLKFAALLFIAGLLGVGALKVYSSRTRAAQADGRARQAENGERDEQDERPEKYLFVWAGDQARMNPDFLAVINFD